MKLPRLHIFTAGTHKAMGGQTLTYSAADLEAIAAAYDPSVHEAPIVIGHPKDNAPAFGWVERLFVEGGKLYAELTGVAEEFAEWVERGLYKKRSSSFYLPEFSPTPGQMYLRHVGFLGAQPPAVKGLEPFAFAEADGFVEFGEDHGWLFRNVGTLFRGMRDLLVGQLGADAVEKAVPSWLIDETLVEAGREMPRPQAPAFSEPPATNPTDPPMDKEKNKDDATAEFAEREQKLQEQEAQFAEREQKLAARERQAQRQQIADFVEGLVEDSARVLPVYAPVVEEMLATVDHAEAQADAPIVVEFGEGDAKEKKPLGQALRDWLAALPKQVAYGEHLVPASDAPDVSSPAKVAEAARDYVDEQATKGRTVSYAEAVQHVKATVAT